MRILIASILLAITATWVSAQTSLNTLTTISGAINGTVYSIVVDDTNVYIGGSFDSIDNLQVNHIARWDGKRWYALGPDSAPGLNGAVRTILIDSLKRIWVGGKFSMAGAVPCSCIASFIGGKWDSLGGGVDDTVFALHIKDSALWVGGAFRNVDGKPIPFLAKWNGNWNRVYSGNFNGAIKYFVQLDGFPDPRKLHLSGEFTSYTDSVENPMHYNCFADSVPLNYFRYSGPLTGYFYHSKSFYNNGPLMCSILFGNFSVHGLGDEGIDYRTPGCQRDGSWNVYQEYLNGPIFSSIILDSTMFVVAGSFSKVGYHNITNIALFDGADYVALPTRCAVPVYAIAKSGTGFYYVGSNNLWGPLQLTKFSKQDKIIYAQSTLIKHNRHDHHAFLTVKNSPASTGSLHFTVASLYAPYLQDQGDAWLKQGEDTTVDLSWSTADTGAYLLPIGLFVMTNADFQSVAGVTYLRSSAAKVSLSAYPNPCTTAAHLSLPLTTDSPSLIDVFDAIGRQVTQIRIAAGSQAVDWDVRELPPGLYFLSQGSTIGRVVVQR